MITKEIELQLLTAASITKPIPVRGLFHYDPADPYGIRVVFRVGGDAETVEWVFGRDLVVTGLSRETGQGDVKIWPAEDLQVDLIFFSLSSPEGEALLSAKATEVRQFVDWTYVEVPYGAEEDFMDLDSTILALLGEEL